MIDFKEIRKAMIHYMVETELELYCERFPKTYKRVFREYRFSKFKSFVKRHRKAIATILLTVALFISYFVLNRIANAWRGYKAVGGEILVFIIPFLIVALRNCVVDMIDEFKNRHK